MNIASAAYMLVYFYSSRMSPCVSLHRQCLAHSRCSIKENATGFQQREHVSRAYQVPRARYARYFGVGGTAKGQYACV